MFKIVFLVHKRPDMDAQEFRRHWRETQGSLGSRFLANAKYVQNHSVIPAGSPAAPYDGFAEMWFDSKEAFERAMATPEAQAAIADLPNFIDTTRMQSFVVDEINVV